MSTSLSSTSNFHFHFHFHSTLIANQLLLPHNFHFSFIHFLLNTSHPLLIHFTFTSLLKTQLHLHRSLWTLPRVPGPLHFISLGTFLIHTTPIQSHKFLFHLTLTLLQLIYTSPLPLFPFPLDFHIFTTSLFYFSLFLSLHFK